MRDDLDGLDFAPMKQIRLCWIATRTNTIDGSRFECGSWRPDTTASREELGEILDVGTHVLGEGSHWIEEREYSLVD